MLTIIKYIQYALRTMGDLNISQSLFQSSNSLSLTSA